MSLSSRFSGGRTHVWIDLKNHQPAAATLSQASWVIQGWQTKSIRFRQGNWRQEKTVRQNCRINYLSPHVRLIVFYISIVHQYYFTTHHDKLLSHHANGSHFFDCSDHRTGLTYGQTEQLLNTLDDATAILRLYMSGLDRTVSTCYTIAIEVLYMLLPWIYVWSVNLNVQENIIWSVQHVQHM